MKLRIFQSSHGDCLLLESAAGKRILCDGGMPDAMTRFVAPALDALRRREPTRPIDVVYVSHVDQDHIGGIEVLLENAAEWLVFDRHPRGSGYRRPDVPRPPKIGAIWHNAFKDQIGSETVPIENLIAASARSHLAMNTAYGLELGHEMSQIALGVEEAIRVSRLAKDVLGIPINEIPGAPGPAKLLMTRRNQQPFSLPEDDAMTFKIIGPTEAELKELRKGWNVWLRSHQADVDAINREIRERMRALAGGELEASVALRWNEQPGYRGVSTPNIASLVMLVREGEKSLLLTGDAQHDLIMRHMREAGELDDAGLHLTCLKVPHHGSNYNMSDGFAHMVSADHYVFCGNGDNGNPDAETIDWIFESRVSRDRRVRALAQEAQDNRPFHFWFSTTSSTRANDPESRATFRKRERQVERLRERSGGRLEAHYNSGVSIDLAL